MIERFRRIEHAEKDRAALFTEATPDMHPFIKRRAVRRRYATGRTRGEGAAAGEEETEGGAEEEEAAAETAEMETAAAEETAATVAEEKAAGAA